MLLKFATFFPHFPILVRRDPRHLRSPVRLIHLGPVLHPLNYPFLIEARRSGARRADQRRTPSTMSRSPHNVGAQGYDVSKGTGRRWLLVSSSSCNDLTAVSFVLELLAHYGASAGHRALLNYFDARPRTPCPALDQVRNASHLVPDYVASFSFVPGFKTRLWRTLPPELTASYQYVWLRDSDVITTPRLFAPAEVEYWMHVTAATVAAPSVLPFVNTKPVHGWWTPWRSNFAGTCLAAQSHRTMITDCRADVPRPHSEDHRLAIYHRLHACRYMPRADLSDCGADVAHLPSGCLRCLPPQATRDPIEIPRHGFRAGDVLVRLRMECEPV